MLGEDGESQLQAPQVSHAIKHGGGAIFVWGCMTFGERVTCVRERAGEDDTSFVSKQSSKCH